MAFDERAEGVYAISATPFHDDGRLDAASLDRLTDFYLGCGASGLTILGIMGEAHKLDFAESVAIVRQVARRAGAVPVVAGVSAPGVGQQGPRPPAAAAAGAPPPQPPP
jgi:4-hydroxy-tetrahydrodipicolinate synthase